ncbi:MAG: DNA mismatch repair protein MutS [Paludibacteraceae bacterium]|nr:DNA mismatch repair protein MutS [Paludibacteraceae bacterium]
METPLMKQYFDVKRRYPDTILLFRVGDFYETYSSDAVIASKVLGITLTHRSNSSEGPMEMAGVPYHAIDNYLPKLVRAGYRVAVCDQLEDPKTTKTLVKRGVTEIVTPGVSYNDNVLDVKSNNFVAAVHFDKSELGIAFLDISTGEFLASQGSQNYVEKLISSFMPKELLYNTQCKDKFKNLNIPKIFTYAEDDWCFSTQSATERLQKQFSVASLKGFGVDNMVSATVAAGAILYYLDQTEHSQTSHITALHRIDNERFVWMDKFTVRNLELFQPSSPDGKSLADILDFTKTPMGSRTLKRWIAFPLKDIEKIEERQKYVELYYNDRDITDFLFTQLPLVGDMERVVSKVAVGRATPRALVQLKTALYAVEQIAKRQPELFSDTDLCTSLRDLIETYITDEPPLMISKGEVIKAGVNDELDEYRNIAYSGKDYLLNIQKRESETTGIPSLKISYNNVFGYYIEVRNMHKDKVPAEWIRKQTLANAERYITQELKEYEEKILVAEEKIAALETQIFNDILSQAATHTTALQKLSHIIANIDALCSLGVAAKTHNYNKPALDNTTELDITEGRHPVIETQMPIGEEYIPNSVHLDTTEQQIIIITGPNMAGKSALLRQTALITLMAQIGSFVPAQAARIGLVDKIFTRVGASDNISMGESTFMVEMNEAASILNNMSERSLVLFDELGRGTSTYDGISIAWAIVEYIHENPTAKARTLFATHYHELNEMEKNFKRVKNFNISVRESENKVIFLRRLIRGGSEHSFGIHVAQMAGMPKSIVKRASEVLKKLEGENSKGVAQGLSHSKKMRDAAESREGLQLSFFQLDDPVLSQVRQEIMNLDINSLTPLEALNKLNEIKRIITG